MDVYSKILLTLLILYWWMTTIYMILWHNDKGNLNFGTIVLAIFFGVAIAPVVWSEMRKQKKEHEKDFERRAMNHLRLNASDHFERYMRDYIRRYENVPIINNTPKTKKRREYKLLRGYDKD